MVLAWFSSLLKFIVSSPLYSVDILCFAAGVPMENILYLGGPNIASEIYNMEYANARICGSEKWRRPVAKFLRQPHFIVWDNGDLVTHEVMGGLKNVYAIGAGKIQFHNSTWTVRNKLNNSIYQDPGLLIFPNAC